MANLIINNYCNQKCDYCFAWKNMGDDSLKDEMSLKTFLHCLQHLKNVWDSRVRILWWEPFLHPKISQFFHISIKGGFSISLFSNLKISEKTLLKSLDFWDDFDYSRIMINLNLNDKDFYRKEELDVIFNSLRVLQQKKIELIISYNIYEYSNGYDFIFDTAKKFGVSHVILKVTNTVIGEEEIIDSNSHEYGDYIYSILDTYSQKFHITFWCGLSRYIFSSAQISSIQDSMGIDLKWWCENNWGKYDINTDGSIFRCYPLQSLYSSFQDLNIHNPYTRNMSYKKLKNFLEMRIPRKEFSLLEDAQCIGNQINKQ